MCTSQPVTEDWAGMSKNWVVIVVVMYGCEVHIKKLSRHAMEGPRGEDL
jgi:hypothetical protein